MTARADAIRQVLNETRRALDDALPPHDTARHRAQFDRLVMELREAGFSDIMVGAIVMQSFQDQGMVGQAAIGLVDYCADVRPA